jgi:hypothetical protein
MATVEDTKVLIEELKDLSGADDVSILRWGDEDRDPASGQIIAGEAIAEFKFGGKKITKSLTTLHSNPKDALRETARMALADGPSKLVKEKKQEADEEHQAAIDSAKGAQVTSKDHVLTKTPDPNEGKSAKLPPELEPKKAKASAKPTANPSGSPVPGSPYPGRPLPGGRPVPGPKAA